MTRIIEYRDVRPDGAVLVSWVCPEGQEYGYDYSQHGPGGFPWGPWERQRREPGAEWVTVGGMESDGSTWWIQSAPWLES
jgi:hypothetical protein